MIQFPLSPYRTAMKSTSLASLKEMMVFCEGCYSTKTFISVWWIMILQSDARCFCLGWVFYSFPTLGEIVGYETLKGKWLLFWTYRDDQFKGGNWNVTHWQVGNSHIMGRAFRKTTHEVQTWGTNIISFVFFVDSHGNGSSPRSGWKMIHKWWHIVEFPPYYVGLLKGSNSWYFGCVSW